MRLRETEAELLKQCDALTSKFASWLVIGNAAGLAGLASATIGADEMPPFISAYLTAGWAFFVGLIAAVFALVSHKQFLNWFASICGERADLVDGSKPSDPSGGITSAELRDYEAKRDAAGVRAGAGLVIAITSFVVGVAVPLISLTIFR